ncbi:uncharacterized protein LOC144875386 [Branchiostoma floridae x Branchiostoma japonicum]
MGSKLRHLLMFLVIILKEPNMPEADCNALNCAPSSRCSCFSLGLTSIPQDLPRSVHHLYLQFNRISMIRSGAFAKLSQLEWLDLSNNRISMIQPGAFANLSQLKWLDLKDNYISMIQPSTFENLIQLEVLNLSTNRIREIPSGAFANLLHLKWLDLHVNPIKEIRAGAFANYLQLEFLQFGANKMEIVHPGAFANLPRFQKLYLLFNYIKMIQPCTFANLPRLQELALNLNQITMIQPGAFTNLPRLQKLYLYGNQITTILPGTFANLPGLEELNLDKNQITIHPGAFANLPRLQLLKLWHNRMPVIDLSDYGLLQYINVTNLKKNLWQCYCRMVPSGLNNTGRHPLEDRIIVAGPPKFRGQKIAEVIPELVCEEPTISKPPPDIRVTSDTCYNGATASSIVYIFTSEKVNKTRKTLTSTLATPPEKTESNSTHESASSFHTSVFTGGTISGIVFIGTMLFIIWYNRKTTNPPPCPASGANSNIALRSTNTTAVEATGSHQYENVNNQHDQTGQGQSLIVGNLSRNEVLAALKPNTMYAGVGTQSKVQTSTSGHDQTGHGQTQSITESTTSTTAAVVTSGHDQIEQGKSQADRESLTSGHDHQYKYEDKTEQGQSQTIVETLDAENYSYGTGMTASQPNPLYKSVG